jgi:DNA-binding MarR family transcriptional regulator
MHPNNIRTLKLLEAIEADPGPSQRDLAQQLGVSLGLVNAFVRRLARKGYFKVRQVPKNRARYILTPRGALEKTHLTLEYIQFSRISNKVNMFVITPVLQIRRGRRAQGGGEVAPGRPRIDEAIRERLLSVISYREKTERREKLLSVIG